MLFNSPVFLFLFLPLAYFGYWRLRAKAARYVFLTAAGYVFYSFWNVKFCALMAFSTMVSYLAGLGFLRTTTPRVRRLCLIIPITVDLTLLAVFKYADFALRSANSLATYLGFHHNAQLLSFILPVGISFYTFHTITYIVDSYRGTIKPTRNFFEFAAYVSFFPQLVAGPIVRFRQVESDLENLDKADRQRGLQLGWSYFAIGLIKKVLIADTIAAVINPALTAYASLTTLGTWLCVLGYTYQLYFDFSGYSDMAVGLGHMFGVSLPQNFNSPYKATDPSDFWRRWHISLSNCLRDYLYIPLGGNRKHAYTNLVITMLLGGLWHGANWTFVIWGAYHGLLLVIYRASRSHWNALPLLLQRTVTFFLVVIGWVLFRADSLRMARTMLERMFAISTGPLFIGTAVLSVVLIASALVAHLAPNTFELRHEWRPATVGAFALAIVACLMVINAGTNVPFLYFQF